MKKSIGICSIIICSIVLSQSFTGCNSSNPQPIPSTYVDSALSGARYDNYKQNEDSICQSEGLLINNLDTFSGILQSLSNNSGLRIYFAENDNRAMTFIFAPTLTDAHQDDTAAFFTLDGNALRQRISFDSAQKMVNRYRSDKGKLASAILNKKNRSQNRDTGAIQTLSVFYSLPQIKGIDSEITYHLNKPAHRKMIGGMRLHFVTYLATDTAYPNYMNVEFVFTDSLGKNMSVAAIDAADWEKRWNKHIKDNGLKNAPKPKALGIGNVSDGFDTASPCPIYCEGSSL